MRGPADTEPMPRVLLIEDDRAVREGVALALRRHGHDVAAAETGEEGLERLRSFRPDVVVLDLMLPGMPGLDVCRAMRALDQTLPILMATARGDDVDIVVGLEAGADDYVVKPVQARVLEARIRAVLRRATAAAATDGGIPKIDTYGELAIDRAGHSVTWQGVPVPLAPSELRLLLTLSAAPGQVFSRRATPGSGLGTQLPRRRAPGGRLRQTAAGQDGRALARAALHPDRARLRLPIRVPVRNLSARNALFPRLRGLFPRLRGLRTRLVVAFALVAALTAATTGALSFREARTGVLQQSQDTVIKLLRTQVDRLAPQLSFPRARPNFGASPVMWPAPSRPEAGGCWSATRI